MLIGLATTADLPEMDQDEATLAAALAVHAVDSELAVWDDPEVDWSRYDGVIIRSTWDYTGRRDAYLAWADHVDEVSSLWNPATVVAWNTHKGYLLELEDRGVPIVPTAWLAQGDAVSLAELAATRGWRDVVAKPCVGAGAEGLLRADGDLSQHQAAFAALLAAGDVMVQPFLTRLATDGELSVIVIDGVVSHAVRKRAKPGDIRIQIEFGGSYAPETPSDDDARLAAWIVESTGHDLLYARVDLVPDDDGTMMLGELEAVEPALYLDWDEGRGDSLARALIGRVADAPNNHGGGTEQAAD